MYIFIPKWVIMLSLGIIVILPIITLLIYCTYWSIEFIIRIFRVYILLIDFIKNRN